MSVPARKLKKHAIGLCLVPLVLASLLADCGGGGGSSDASEVESALTGYLDDFVSGDGEGVCEAMSDSEARTVTEEIAESEPAFKSLSCAEVITKVSEVLGQPEKEALEDEEIDDVEVDGDFATAEFESGTEPARFKKIDGSWYLTGGGLK